MNNQPVLITVGLISKPHNMKGALKVIPITDFPERFLERDEILVEIGEKIELVEIEEVSNHNNYLILKLQGIDTIEQAQRLKGCYLKVPRSQLPELENEDEYYIFELIGINVQDINGNNIGKLKDVLKTNANDVYVVENENGKEVLIPALKKVVKKIDLESNIMVVSMLPE